MNMLSIDFGQNLICHLKFLDIQGEFNILSKVCGIIFSNHRVEESLLVTTQWYLNICYAWKACFVL